jgi:hypothetical protein
VTRAINRDPRPLDDGLYRRSDVSTKFPGESDAKYASNVGPKTFVAFDDGYGVEVMQCTPENRGTIGLYKDGNLVSCSSVKHLIDVVEEFDRSFADQLPDDRKITVEVDPDNKENPFKRVER